MKTGFVLALIVTLIVLWSTDPCSAAFYTALLLAVAYQMGKQIDLR